MTSLDDWLVHFDRSVGIVFTDVVESTMLLYKARTVSFARIVRAYRDRAARVIGKLEGRLVDETGDEILAVFPRATNAYLFAHEFLGDPGHPSLRIRVGVHFGAVRADGERLIGRNVHLCARVMQQAGDRELWLSEAAKSALEADSGVATEPIRWIESQERELKGIPDPQRLWRAA